nr:metallophosphoesterase family protein [Chromatiaceae bacterium]
LVCCGHSHHPLQQWVPHLKGGQTLLLNPGTVGGVGQAAATWFLVDLETLECEAHELDKSLERRAQAPTAA